MAAGIAVWRMVRPTLMNLFLSPSSRWKGFALFLFFGLLPFRQWAYVLPPIDCPPDQTIVPAPGACEALLDFESLAWSTSVQAVDTLFEPGPGHLFQVGTTTPVTITVTDASGSTASCVFEVTVDHFDDNLIACNNLVLFDLDSTCTAAVTYDRVLESPLGCPSNYVVQLLTPNGGLLPPILLPSDVGITRTYRLTELSTGAACWGSVVVNTGTLPLELTCPADTQLLCYQPLDPAFTGVPTYFSCLDSLGVALDFVDNTTNSFCGNGIIVKTVLRTWTVADTFNNVRTCQQTITARRGTLSQIIFPEDLTIPCLDTNTYLTQTDTSLTGVPLLEGGSPTALACQMSVVFTDSVTHLCGASYRVERTWLVLDNCLDESLEHTQVMVVEDLVPPVIGLPDTLLASSMAPCGDDIVFPPATISGECAGFSVSVASPWQTLPTNGGLSGVFTTPGTYPLVYTATDECQNSASDTLLIVVQPGYVAACPPDLTVTCDFFETEIVPSLAAGDSAAFNLLGEMQFYANCFLTPTQSLAFESDSCGVRSVTRILGAEELPDECVQVVTVEHVSDFQVVFPADLLYNCQFDSIPVEEPVVTGGTCEQLSIAYTDSIVTLVADACYKILRKWTVDDHCTPGGAVTHVQSIKITDNVDPVFLNGCSLPPICLDSSSCNQSVMLPAPAVGECGEYSLTAQFKIGGVWLNGFGPFSGVPAGNYEVRYLAADKCNNQTTCLTMQKVENCEAPVALCKQTLQVELLPNGTTTLWAQDLNAGSYNPCSGSLQYSLDGASNLPSLSLDCDDLGLDTFTLWVTNAKGLQASCQTEITVVPAFGGCEVGALANGSVFTELYDAMEGVVLSSSIGSVLTDAAGEFSIVVSETATDELVPTLDDDYLNGVTTFDIVLIRKHIIGSDLLDSPYKIIAADVDRSGAVTTFDLVLIQKLVLFNIFEFPNGPAWRFVDAAYVFPDPSNPFSPPFPETIFVTWPDMIPPSADFIGIKLGDVNNSAN